MLMFFPSFSGAASEQEERNNQVWELRKHKKTFVSAVLLAFVDYFHIQLVPRKERVGDTCTILTDNPLDDIKPLQPMSDVSTNSLTDVDWAGTVFEPYTKEGVPRLQDIFIFAGHDDTRWHGGGGPPGGWHCTGSVAVLYRFGGP